MDPYILFSNLLIIVLFLSIGINTNRSRFFKSTLAASERKKIKQQSAFDSWVYIIFSMGLRMVFPSAFSDPQPEVYYIILIFVIYFTSYFIRVNRESY